MNYEPSDWYNELYRIFAGVELLTAVQTAKLGDCLRLLAAGQNALFALNDLFYSVRGLAAVADSLEEYIHAYIEHEEEKEESQDD